MNMELPHAEPIKLISEYQLQDNSVKASYTIPIDHPVLAGHFPHIAVWPGVYIIEGMNQTAGIHALNSAKKSTDEEIDLTKIITFVTSIDKVKFREPCFPGDTLEYTAELVKQKANHMFYACKVFKNNRQISSATVGLTAKKL